MAHKIEKRDTLLLADIPELFSGKGWHGLGTPHNDFTVDGCAPVLWGHAMADAGIVRPDGTFFPTGERYAVANDDGLPVGGAVGRVFFTPQNRELFELFMSALEGSPYKIVSVGTVENRCQWWVDAKGDATKTVRRDFTPFVGLHRGFGGLSKIRVGGHQICMQCANTTRAFVAEIDGGSAKGISTLKNTLRAERPEILESLKSGIEAQHGVTSEFLAAMRDAESAPIAKIDARNAFVGLLAPVKAKELSGKNSRTVNRANRLFSLFGSNSAGNRGETIADWVSAVTDYYSHESAGSLDSADSREEFFSKQWLSSEFGAGADAKARVIGEVFNKGAVNPVPVELWAERGAKLIRNSAPEAVVDLVAV